MIGPSERGYEVGRLVARVSELEARCARLEGRPVSVVEFATVSAYPGSGNQCTVTYSSGNSRVVRLCDGFTPAVSDAVVIVNDAAGEGLVVGRKA